MPPRDKTRAIELGVVRLLEERERPLHSSEIANALGSPSPADLRDVLDRLVESGVVVPRGPRRYKLAEGASVGRDRDVEGYLTVNPRGFGFVRHGKSGDDVFIPQESIGGAMHGDRVRARVASRSWRGLDGEVLEVTARGRDRVVGVLRGRGAWLEPDDSRIRGPIEIVGEGAKAGQAAVVAITRYPEDARENPRGKVVAMLGEPGDPKVEVAKILIENRVDEAQPDDASAEALAFGDAPDPAEIARRDDLTGIPLVTIDPADARDHDDAVWVERDDHGHYRAWIAIADVAHYVTPGSALDASALERGCSVYLPDRAVPMLPEALSSGLCSLVEGKPRLCLYVRVDLDPTGKVTHTELGEGHLVVDAGLSYGSVARALGLSTEPARDPRAEERRGALQTMWELCSELRKRRMRRGALDFDVPEARIEVDTQTGLPIEVKQRTHDPGIRKAYRVVEELMLLANEAVARHVLARDLPAIFRVHGAPDPDKLDRFAAMCGRLGIAFDPEDAEDPKQLSRFLRKIAAHDKRELLHMLLLRAMQQACYDVANIGHFGLASTAYLHFTSPIRRYPDLVVHRLLRPSLQGEPSDPDASRREVLSLAAATASKRERDAMAVERQVADLYRALFMQSQVGARYEATITSFGATGAWSRIADPFIDLLVRAEDLGQDRYELDDDGLAMVGARSGERIELGQQLMVEITDVSIVRRSILAKRVGAPDPRASRRGRKGKHKGDPGDRRGRGRGRGRSGGKRGGKGGRKGRR